MIVSLQKGIPIKERLEQMGYKVVYSDEYARSADVYIYSSRDSGRPHYSSVSSFDSFYEPNAFLSSANHISAYENISHGGYGGGAIEINVYGKSFDDIERILLRRRQQKLF